MFLIIKPQISAISHRFNARNYKDRRFWSSDWLQLTNRLR